MSEVVAPIILVADEGPRFGMGHVKRLEYLYQILEPSIQRVTRLISAETHPSSFVGGGFQGQFWQEVYEVISNVRPGLCVFDLSYSSWELLWDDFAKSFLPSSKSIGIDAPQEWMHRFNFVIHPGIAKPEWSEGHSSWHGGPSWVLADRSPSWIPNNGVPKITVTTGSQAFDTFRPWLDHELARLSGVGMEISWVVGKHGESQLASLNSRNRSIAFVDDAELSERFSHSDLVITRFGVTALELTARGVPTIILPGWSEGEKDEVFELECAGIALVARSNHEVFELALHLAQNRSLQTALSTRAKEYFKLENTHPLSLLVSNLVSEDN